MKRLKAEEQGEMESIKTALSLSHEGRRPRKIHKPDDDGVFVCKTCGRRFPSFQALGGHQTGHNRRGVSSPGLDLLQGSRLKAAAAHECPICGRRFSMGQALGGHMRRHKPSRDAFPEKKAGAQKSMLDFNFIPLPSDCKRGTSPGVLLELFV